MADDELDISIDDNKCSPSYKHRRVIRTECSNVDNTTSSGDLGKIPSKDMPAKFRGYRIPKRSNYPPSRPLSDRGRHFGQRDGENRHRSQDHNALRKSVSLHLLCCDM